jgi:hypothetical protein
MLAAAAESFAMFAVGSACSAQVQEDRWMGRREWV